MEEKTVHLLFPSYRVIGLLYIYLKRLPFEVIILQEIAIRFLLIGLASGQHSEQMTGKNKMMAEAKGQEASPHCVTSFNDGAFLLQEKSLFICYKYTQV